MTPRRVEVRDRMGPKGYDHRPRWCRHPGGTLHTMPPFSRREHPTLSGRQLIVRFSVAAFLALAVVAVTSAVVSRSVGREEAVADAKQVAYVVARGIVEPAITQDVVDITPEGIATMDDVMRRTIIRGSLVRVKIWKADGTIVYSDERRLIGQRFELDDEELEILRKGGSQAEVTNLNKPENQYEAPINFALLEAYSSLDAPNGEKLLFEGYFRYDAVVDTGKRAWSRFAPVSLGSLAVLELLQFPIVIGLIRRLKRDQKDRERLLANAIDSSDAERRRIARDLHDGVVQDLTGVSYSLTAATLGADGPTPVDPAVAANAAVQIREAVKSLRSLLVEIYPPNLLEEGLEAGLSDLLTRCSVRGLETNLRVQSGPVPLDPSVLTLLYRGAQEALRNVIKHAGASSVSVEVVVDDHLAKLTVIDDGAGFDPEVVGSTAADGHVGLKVLGDLVAEAGGVLALRSPLTGGTSFILEVPVP